MKGFQSISTIIIYIGLAALAGVGLAMANTNPSEDEYEKYALQQLTLYLKSNVCQKTPTLLENLIKLNCAELVDSVNPQLQAIIAGNTQRQDFIILSVYTTKLELNPLIPSYQFETVGVFNSFFTYSAERQ
jgi:hypothetical protein